MRISYLSGLILLLALAAAACSDEGGSSDIASLETNTTDASQDAETTPDPIVETEAAMLAFTQCLREQGVEIDDPTVDADGNVQLPPIELTTVSDGTDPGDAMADLEAIMAPCEEHLEGITTAAGDLDTTEIEDDLLEYAQCMRDNGVDMPDPDFSSNGGMIDLGAGDEEAFEAADAECRHLLSRLGIGG